MQVLLVVALVVMGGLLLGFATYAAWVGLLGAVSGERFERCGHCGHPGLTMRGRRHEAGCPAGVEAELISAWHHIHPAP